MFFSKKSYLGVDIGSFGVKIVELEQGNQSAVLKNYGFNEIDVNNFVKIENLDVKRIAENINFVHKKAGFISREAIASLPAFSVFSSIITLTGVPEKNLDSAVRWEAKKIIPLPIEEMVIDWKKIESDKEKNIKVLVTGAPKILVNKYIEIFKLAKIRLLGLETEVFALIRSLLLDEQSANMVVDFGAGSTDIIVVNKNVPVISRSVDVGGYILTKALQERSKSDLKQAEQFKYDLGVSNLSEHDLPDIALEIFKPVVSEIKYVLDLVSSKKEFSLDRIILTGGSALVCNLPSYLEKTFNKKTIIGNPWYRVEYPESLSKTLDEVGPKMSVAIGLAMRNIFN